MITKKYKRRKFLFILNTDKFLLSHRIEIANMLIKNNYEVHLGSAQTEYSKEINNLGIKTHNISINRTRIGLISLIKTSISIYRLIKKINPDIVHFVSIKPVILGCIATKFYKKNLKIIVSISGLGFIFIDRNLFGSLKRLMTCILYKFSLSNKKIKVIFQNKTDRDFIKKICNLSNSQCILINGSGVNLEKFKPIKEINIKTEKIVLLPARIVKSKGIYEFIQSAKKLKGRAKFIICGDFDFDAKDSISFEEIKVWVKNSTIDYIGYKTNMEEIIAQSSIVVLPSYREGLPKVLCEAAACGIPVITTNVPGCRDAIINEQTGILVPPRESKELSLAIISLLKNPERLKRMGEAGRRLAEEIYDIKKIVNTHMQLYRNI